MVTINKLEIENVKRVKAVKLEPSATGLTIVGGNNNQGKTSVLDAIAWALGGNKFKPSQAQREGSTIPPSLKITLSNGLIVERSGKNSTLKVIDPSGNKAGQNLLDSFVEELAINLPKFMEQTSKEKAKTLLQIIGVGPQLVELEMQEKAKYDERHAIGVIADQKKSLLKSNLTTQMHRKSSSLLPNSFSSNKLSLRKTGRTLVNVKTWYLSKTNTTQQLQK